MEIVGSEGIISPSGGGANGIAILPYPNVSSVYGSEKWEIRQICELPPTGDNSLANGNQLAILDLIDAIKNDRKPISSAEDAVAALEMIVGAYESQLTGKRVYFPMANRVHPLTRRYWA